MKLRLGDCRKVLREMPACSIETCITDPPYGLGFMGREWDKKKAKMRWVSERLREGVGLYDFTVEWASEVFRILKPGGMLLSFGGTRTVHRIACGIEDAGFELRDMLMWLHGQGFPKPYNISKGIDALKGTKGKLIRSHTETFGINKTRVEIGHRLNMVKPGETREPGCPEAVLWEGWHANLKPAWEPLILAMKPLEGGFARNALRHGVAGLAIEKGRIKGSVTVPLRVAHETGYGGGWGEAPATTTSGRWPTNVLLSHDPRCVKVGEKILKAGKSHGHPRIGPPSGTVYDFADGGSRRHAGAIGEETVDVCACVSGCPVRMLDEQTKKLQKSKGRYIRKHGDKQFLDTMGDERIDAPTGLVDFGGASRFFYTAKASAAEREQGLLGHVPCGKCGKLSSKTHRAEVRVKMVDVPCRRNLHPTVKPLALMQYLCRLTRTPSGGTVLDPFMGSGTTGVACSKEKRDFIGIEQDEKAFEIAKHRIAWAGRTVARVKGKGE